MQVHIFIPCFIDQMYPETGFNMVKILEQNGVNVIYNANQTCCGQPAFNAGFINEAKPICEKFISDFKDAQYIIIPSASCAGFIKNYYKKIFEATSELNIITELEKKIYEFSEFMVDVLKIENVNAVFNKKVTYHDSCAALREMKIKDAPRKLLSNVKGLQVIEMKDNTTCCGFGGSFAVKFDNISAAMADQKVGHALETGAEIIVSTDLSCLMHIEAFAKKNGKNITTMHIADVLAMNS